MNIDSYIIDQQLDDIRREYAEKIYSFSSVEDILLQWYANFEFRYPASCVNNYRDAWFHYRRIWKERSYYEMVCQMATLDEHLQRAEKDAIVNLFQKISQGLEFWYLLDDEKYSDALMDRDKEKVDNLFEGASYADRVTGEWVYNVWKMMSGTEKQKSYGLCYAVSKYYLDYNERRIELQKVLHSIKNATLLIRFGASDIQRLEHPGEYLKKYQTEYNKVSDLFNKNPLYIFLLDMTRFVQFHVKE